MKLFKKVSEDQISYNGEAISFIKFTGYRCGRYGINLRLPFKVGCGVYQIPSREVAHGDWQMVLYIQISFGKYGIPKVGYETELVSENIWRRVPVEGDTTVIMPKVTQDEAIAIAVAKKFKKEYMERFVS